jgi:hypothetical protein
MLSWFLTFHQCFGWSEVRYSRDTACTPRSLAGTFSLCEARSHFGFTGISIALSLNLIRTRWCVVPRASKECTSRYGLVYYYSSFGNNVTPAPLLTSVTGRSEVAASDFLAAFRKRKNNGAIPFFVGLFVVIETYKRPLRQDWHNENKRIGTHHLRACTISSGTIRSKSSWIPARASSNQFNTLSPETKLTRPSVFMVNIRVHPGFPDLL